MISINVTTDVTGQSPTGVNGQHDKDAHWIAARTFSLDELHALGYDCHSIIADPQCRDLEHFDFTLADDSPALALGFRPIDLSDVGPRPANKRE